MISGSTTQTHLSYSTNVVQIHPGDHCVLLRAVKHDDAKNAQGQNFSEEVRTHHGLLIGSILRQGLGKPTEQLLWVDIEENGDGRASIRYAGSSNVTDMPTWIKSRRGGGPHTGYDDESKRYMGFLRDGSRYVVYRSGWMGSPSSSRLETRVRLAGNISCHSDCPSRTEGGLGRPMSLPLPQAASRTKP